MNDEWFKREEALDRQARHIAYGWECAAKASLIVIIGLIIWAVLP